MPAPPTLGAEFPLAGLRLVPVGAALGADLMVCFVLFEDGKQLVVESDIPT